MAYPLEPNGTNAEIYLSGGGWGTYKPTKMRVKCNSSWDEIRVISAGESIIYSGSFLGVLADTFHEFELEWDAPWDQGIMGIAIYRNQHDPTPNDMGAVVTAIEFGPEEKPLTDPH